MEIEFTLEKADLIEGTNWQSKYLAQAANGQVIAPKVFLWGMLVIIYLYGNYLDKGEAGVPFVFLALMSVTILYRKWFSEKLVKIRCSEEFTGDTLTRQKIILNRNFLTNIRQSSKAEYFWNAVKEIVYTETQTFIVFRTKNIFIVPRRTFKDPAAFEEFKNKLNTYWGDGRYENRIMPGL